MNKKFLGAALASLSLFAVAASFNASPALAGQSSTCDSALVTLTKTSSADGSLLPNATYLVQASEAPRGLEPGAVGGSYFVAGDATALEEAFNEAFNSQFAPLSATEAGRAIEAAYATNLGDMAPYPTDITGITDPAVQAQALALWQADRNGEVAAFKADAEARLAAVNALLAANPSLSAVDPEFYAHATEQAQKLQAVVDSVSTAQGTSDWATFVEAYSFMTDHGNWSFGITETPGLAYTDFLNGVTEADYAAANAYAASVVGATQQLSVVTDGSGRAQFTVFGVNYGNGDRFTRGDMTCSQHAGTVTEAEAPQGFTLDPNAYSFQADESATAALELTDDPTTVVVPPSPVFTDTGL